MNSSDDLICALDAHIYAIIDASCTARHIDMLHPRERMVHAHCEVLCAAAAHVRVHEHVKLVAGSFDRNS